MMATRVALSALFVASLAFSSVPFPLARGLLAAVLAFSAGMLAGYKIVGPSLDRAGSDPEDPNPLDERFDEDIDEAFK